ncbi:transcriptional regulator BetI [Meridianimarinicoccus roseus]|jgi:TetR/AcrR family transcriptional repressor of bet genes|uniref:HTH-type transcriptional regulator BetI n=1 Tax=Meridianimarinicoccus roseus TaxID=2072018 RepID=A0A2V2LDJ7_9RHOB|nr:transcriptional regulator BetI [Meridianimarinicoccus roseus]PWR03608.1 transcriptional regulator BetI [Meridianimarinicoccus roseus]
MKRANVQALRKSALIAATIDQIGATGSLEVTVSQIARKAGVSSALAHHYFGSKDQLFLAAMRAILSDFGAEVRAECAGLETPRRRVDAIVRTCFSPGNFRPEVVASWLNFYVLAQTSREAHRLLRVYQRRLHSNLLAELRPVADVRAPQIAQTVGALIDGLYIRQALRNESLDAAASIGLVTDYLDGVLGAKPQDSKDHRP